eukprot:symbB.v1.2.023208.t1/scaffold2101.1/size89465/9
MPCDAYQRSDSQLLKALQLLGHKPNAAGLQGLVTLRRFRRAPQTAIPVLRNLRGFPWQALTLLKALKVHQVEIDVFHVNVVLDICSKAGAWSLALASAIEAEADVAMDVVSFGSLTNACAARGHWMNANDVVNFMLTSRDQVPNLITYSSLLHGLASARRWSMAVMMLTALEQAGTSPTETGFSSVLNACGGQWPRCLQLLRPQGGRFEVNSVISACEKGGVWELAMWILYAMSKWQAVPDTISYSSAISACAKRGFWENALQLLFEMTTQRIPVNDISFNAVIGACKEDGRWAEAVSLLFLMEEGSYPPDVVSFGSAISACDVAGHWEAALGLLICMQEKKVLPNILCFSGALLSLRGMQAAPLGVWCMAMGLLKQVYMARVAMDVPGLDAVAKACDAAAQFAEQPQLLRACEELWFQREALKCLRSDAEPILDHAMCFATCALLL